MQAAVNTKHRNTDLSSEISIPRHW